MGTQFKALFDGIKLEANVRAVLLMAASCASLLFGYEFIRSISNTLFKLNYGVQNLPVIMIFVPLFLLPMLYGYNHVLSKYGPRKTFFFTSIFSSLSILICYIGIRLDIKIFSALLYLVRESYIILIIEQVWSFVNSILDQKTAKKYNGMILAISSLGAMSGGFTVHFLAEIVGTENLLLMAALTCVPTGFIGIRAHRLYPIVGDFKEKKSNHDESKYLGLSLFKEQQVLYLILFMIISSQIYSTVATLNFQFFLQDAYPSVDKQTSVSGLFFGCLHVVGIFFQFVVSPILLATFSVGRIHIGIPTIHFLTALCACIFPSIWTAGLSLMMFKSIDYSVFRSAKEILYIPLSFDARFRAKELIDVFGYRFSKSGASLLVIGSQYLGVIWAGFGLAVLSLMTSFTWLACVWPMSRGFTKAKVEQNIKAATSEG